MEQPEIQTELFATLANLCCHEANAKHIIQNGGCRIILSTMKKYPFLVSIMLIFLKKNEKKNNST